MIFYFKIFYLLIENIIPALHFDENDDLEFEGYQSSEKIISVVLECIKSTLTIFTWHSVL